MKLRQPLASALLLALLVTPPVLAKGTPAAKKSAIPAPVSTLKEAAPGIRYAYVETYDLARLRGVLTTGLRAFLTGSPYPAEELVDKLKDVPQVPVRIYRVEYDSMIPEQGNKPVLGTGLVAIPVTPTKTLPIVSYQHGTVFGREEVPSMLANSYETMASVAVFASQGFVVTGADYFGLGGSTQAPNSYGVPGSTEQACLDMLKAARAVMKAEGLTPSQLFVNGWSQGGYNTLRFLKRLEMAGEPVTAASTASAPTDVHLWIGRLLTNPQPGDAIWLVGCASNLMMAADSYSAPGFAASVIRPEYMDSARRFYTFQMSWPEYAKTLPATLQDYFKPEFLASFRYGTNPFWEKLDASENYRWAVQTPLRNYYGEADEAIPVDIALMPSRVAKLLGTGTTAVSAGPKADHRATYLYSLTELPAWYRSFMK